MFDDVSEKKTLLDSPLQDESDGLNDTLDEDLEREILPKKKKESNSNRV